jgi:5'-nucleotidase
MVQLLNSLPPGTVDAVVAGHTHQVVHHLIAGVPVIQGGAFGRYINVIYLTYDWQKKQIIPDRTRIEGPVPVCAKVFRNQNDCNGDRPEPKNGKGPLVPAQFHGKTIEPDPQVLSLLRPYLNKTEEEKNRVIGQAEQSPLGNLVADAIRKAAGSDVALVNAGGIRTSIEQGPITYGGVFQAVPFDNTVAVVQMTGAELKTLLQVAESGSRAFGAVSGVSLRLIDPSYPAPWVDLNGNGKMESWQINRLLQVTLANGEPIDPKKIYSLATIDFLVTGGDDLKWPFSQIPSNRIQLSTGILVRDALIRHIRDLKVIGTQEAPLVDPQKPRFQFEKPPSK